MTNPTEQQLRDLFAADATAAPEAVDLTDGALRKVRHRRRVQLASAAAVVAIALGGGVLATTSLGGRSSDLPIAAQSPSSAASRSSADASAGPTRQGPVPADGSADCVEVYSPAALAKRAFAFDGTVTAIGPARSNRPGAELPLVGVTFHVNQWFRGGSGEDVTVDWYPPHQGNSNTDPSLATYGVGSRLLVSGEPRWGGASLDAAIAWTCGFTRYFDAQTAAAWAAVTK